MEPPSPDGRRCAPAWARSAGVAGTARGAQAARALDPAIEEAVAALRAGELVAFPTETVYGLGADARSEAAVRAVFRAKGRPAEHPLIVHLGAADALEEWAREVPEDARRLFARFAPGPLTVVLPKRADVPDVVTGGQPTVALRIPDHPIALALLRAFGSGIAAPSANRFGSVSPTTAAHVALELGEHVALILDGGPCRVGIESTIVDLSGGAPALLRPGGVAVEAIEAVLGRPLAEPRAGLRAPGRLASHYAPRARVLAVDERALEAAARAGGAGVVVLADREVPGLPFIALPAAPEAAARRLYAALREVDERGFSVAVVALPRPVGLGRAIADRLRRAAASG